ncbi:class I SAM-dependent methyltransferase [Brevibacillus laterosporus]|uniref:class I SAM-dependent methyltransferase n=1 Tax=Brevibacillus laterosporus TaxID=1465 RepID=UPI002656116C|nr:class I SAM-dependent methyltransferase [Brevibacillus laterosporus]MDN9011402.1 class I SAM-dependent methyltransferase [Brevibacillus laterosporus]MDO0942420.1 class I SAM-dependent methyltransferase [Brevibacillus laterosporus]
MSDKKCRFCNSLLTHTFLDLGVSPLANSFISPDRADDMEPFYPLHAYVCDKCFLVQVGQFESPDQIFNHYLYFSSYSSSWLSHAQKYTEMAIARFHLNHHSQVIEIASNDGYLLQYFHKHNIRTLGIEPAKNLAKICNDKGIPTRADFFGERLAKQLVQEGYKGDLIVANNVLAHVPELHDFIAGLKILLQPNGSITIEFPHVLQLILSKQFDTIYHEHFSYFSLLSVQSILSSHELKVVDVEEILTHGGSLRLFVKHSEDKEPIQPSVAKVLEKEQEHGLHQLSTYLEFSKKVKQMKIDILSFFIKANDMKKKIVGYGAPAKGNTLLHFCGIGKELLPYTVDQNPHKQGLILPGSRIPIKNPDEIQRTQPDYVLILPWNLKEEIMDECSYIRNWGGKFVVFVPEVEVL